MGLSQKYYLYGGVSKFYLLYSPRCMVVQLLVLAQETGIFTSGSRSRIFSISSSG
jgi:hypothetical protein